MRSGSSGADSEYKDSETHGASGGAIEADGELSDGEGRYVESGIFRLSSVQSKFDQS